MAARETDGVPSIPKYSDSLATEERRNYDDKLKLVGIIDPYNVSKNYFFESIER